MGALRDEAVKRNVNPSGTKKHLLKKFSELFETKKTIRDIHPPLLEPEVPGKGMRPGALSAAESVIPRGTLVVAPASVLIAWEDQARAHLMDGGLKIVIFHASGKCSSEELAQADLVVTSYSTLAAELNETRAVSSIPKKRKSGGNMASLLSIEWHRIVLDEAHTIRNSQTRASEACRLLKGNFRWCLSGTPIMNRAEDVQPLLSFVRVRPLDDKGIFLRAIGRPLREGDPLGAVRLRVVMRSLCIRRTKALLSASLPPRTVSIVRVRLDEVHREAYDAIFKSASALINSLLADGDQALLSQYSGVLECLLRLRQVCDSVALLSPGRLERAREVVEEIKKLQKKDGQGKVCVPIGLTIISGYQVCLLNH